MKMFIGAMLALCMLCFVLGIAGVLPDPDDNVSQAALYCSMVHDYQQNPDQGWPDFKGVYASQCSPGGSLRKDWSK